MLKLATERYHYMCEFCTRANGLPDFHLPEDYIEGTVRDFHGQELAVNWCQPMWNTYHLVQNVLLREVNIKNGIL